MGFFAEKKLYEVEITEKCTVKALNFLLKILGSTFITNGTAILSPPATNIPIGTTGWIINQWGGKYFAPQNKVTLKNSASYERSNILIPYKNIKGHYKILNNK